MRSRTSRGKKAKRVGASEYVLSIKLATDLIEAIDEQAHAQQRTRASLIRQTLAEKFRKVA